MTLDAVNKSKMIVLSVYSCAVGVKKSEAKWEYRKESWCEQKNLSCMPTSIY
jgi:hypothetical protein